MNEPIETPCIDICQLRKDDELCQGCFRTLEEIAAWGRMTNAERLRIMGELPARKSAITSPGDGEDRQR